MHNLAQEVASILHQLLIKSLCAESLWRVLKEQHVNQSNLLDSVDLQGSRIGVNEAGNKF